MLAPRSSAGTASEGKTPGFPTQLDHAVYGFRTGRADAPAAIAVRESIAGHCGIGGAR